MNTIKRSLFATFLNTTPDEESETWSLMGKGVTEMSIAYNPQVTTEQDVTQDTANSEVTGYQPNMPAEGSARKGDAVYEYVNKLRKNRAVFADCETQVLNVDLYDGDDTDGYAAEKQDVAVQVDTYGGSGGEALTLGFTLNYKGDPVKGKFNPKTATFTPDTDE